MRQEFKDDYLFWSIFLPAAHCSSSVAMLNYVRRKRLSFSDIFPKTFFSA